MRFAIVPVHVSKVLRLPREIEARSYEMLHLSRKIISKPEDPQPRTRNLHLDLLTALTHMSLVLRLPRKIHFRRSSSNVPRLPFRTCYKTLTFFLTFDQVQNPLRLPRKTMRIFNISTSRSALNPSVFNTFHFEMCFAPQRRALFRHLHFQKWSDVGFFCTCWIRNMLRATMACNLCSLIWPDGSAPAALASLLFDPPEPQIIGKTQWITTFLPFPAPASSFFWLFLFSDLLSSSLLFSDSSHLCFSICP